MGGGEPSEAPESAPLPRAWDQATPSPPPGGARPLQVLPERPGIAERRGVVTFPHSWNRGPAPRVHRRRRARPAARALGACGRADVRIASARLTPSVGARWGAHPRARTRGSIELPPVVRHARRVTSLAGRWPPNHKQRELVRKQTGDGTRHGDPTALESSGFWSPQVGAGRPRRRARQRFGMSPGMPSADLCIPGSVAPDSRRTCGRPASAGRDSGGVARTTGTGT